MAYWRRSVTKKKRMNKVICTATCTSGPITSKESANVISAGGKSTSVGRSSDSSEGFAVSKEKQVQREGPSETGKERSGEEVARSRIQ